MKPSNKSGYCLNAKYMGDEKVAELPQDRERVNIFESARLNDQSVQEEYASLPIGRSEEIISKIANLSTFVQAAWQPSINMRVHVAARFVRQGGYQNMRALAARFSRLSDRPADQILNEKLGRWQTPREIFESSFQSGSDFIYAAVNAGGAGPDRYAPFSVIFNRTIFLQDRETAILRGDSLTDYAGDNGLPDYQKIYPELCTSEVAGKSAAIKHADEIQNTDQEKWSEMVCSNSGYHEIIFTDGPKPEELSEVRVSQTEYNRLWDIAFSDFSRKLDPGDEATADDFSELLEVLGDRNIPLTAV